MKLSHSIIVSILILCLSACSTYSPTYFGSKYSATKNVQSFYSASDIKQPFEVIGHMNIATGRSESSQNKTRQVAIEKTKEIGGDGVIFSEINRQVNQHTTDDFTIKVDVIKFK
jgi:hypothetical protein